MGCGDVNIPSRIREGHGRAVWRASVRARVKLGKSNYVRISVDETSMLAASAPAVSLAIEARTATGSQRGAGRCIAA